MENAYITLSRQDWRDLHNALCNAEQQARELFSMLKDGGKGLEAIDAIRTALAPAYAQDDAAFDRKHNYFSKVQSDNKFRSIWSLFDETDVGSFEQNHPFGDVTHVSYSQHWGGKSVEVPVSGSTWLDLYRAADLAIQQSGDGHHIFIESFTPTSTGCLTLSTGS